MQYSTIIDRVAEYLDRSDLGTSASTTISATKIGQWVNDTRKDIALKYDFNYLYVEATISTSAGTATYSLPSDYMGHLTILCAYKKLSRVGAREFDELVYTDDTELTTSNQLELTESDDATSGFPEYYIDRGMCIQLYPNPDDEYTVTMKYYAQPVDFEVASDEDYMARFHFEAIIFGAALRGAVFLDDIQKQQVFKGAYEASVTEIVQREKETKQRDKHVRWKTYKDFHSDTFKRFMKFKSI